MNTKLGLLSCLLLSGLTGSAGVYADELVGGKTDFAPVKNEKYLQECGSCHMAYPADALPERSWRKLMGSLDKHFGENAELAAEDRQQISDYLYLHSAEHSSYRRAVKMLSSIASNATPNRISEVPYFVREHREIAGRIKGNKQVKSLSQCDSCHTKASSGSFAESQINIPGIGRWD